MVFVVLRNGKCVQYNDAQSVSVEDGCVTLRQGKEKWLTARLPLDIVERVEFHRPCAVHRVRINKKRLDY